MEPDVQPTISIDNTPDNSPTINIDTGTAPPQPPSDDVARTRAAKAHMGLGDIISQTYDQIYRNIADGKEDDLRKQAAFQITQDAVAKQQQAYFDLANKSATTGVPINPTDVQSIAQPTTPVDPNSVIEKTYARAYLNSAKDTATNLQDNVITDAQMNDPDAVAAYFNKGSDVLSKRELALKYVQDLQPDVDKSNYFSFNIPEVAQPILGKGNVSFSSYDLKQLASFGFYDEAMLRGNVTGVSKLSGVLLGENVDTQIKSLLDDPDFDNKFKGIMDNLKSHDPALAQKFASYVAGMSTSDKYLNDAMSVVNIATAGEGLGFARGLLKNAGNRQLQTLGQRAASATDRGGLVQGEDGVYRSPPDTTTGPTEPPPPPGGGGEGGNQLTTQQAAKAVTDVVKSANVPEITKATMAEGVGDVKEAAVQKTVNSIITRPDPEKDAVDTLLSLHRADQQALSANPGNLSREDHTRLLDAAAGSEKGIVDVLVDTSKVVRTPALAEEGFRSIFDKVKNYFPGRENTIADVNVRAVDVGQLTHHYDVKIVNYDGTPFSSYELAQRHAELNGYDLRGIEGQAGNKVYIPVAAAKKLESVETTATGTKFFVDHGVEVIPSARPEPNHVPYNLTTNKFEPVLSNETARIEQQGMGFHIVVTKPINETETFIRDGLIGGRRTISSSNDDTGRLRSVGNAIGGIIRNPYDTLSMVENENRAKTVYGQVKYLDYIKQEIKDVEDIYSGMIGDRNVILEKPLSYTRMLTGANKTVAEDFTRALTASQTMPDPKTGLPGYYMQTPAEIQHFWQTSFQRPATFKEQAAYLAVGRLDHFDHILRSASQYMYKARLGVERWTFTTSKDGKILPSPTFEASQIKKVNGSIDEVTLIHDADGSERYFHTMGTKAQNEFREAVAQGKYLGVEIYDPEMRPIKRQTSGHNGGPPLDDLRIRYVFSNAFKREPLTYDQVGYRGGGHWEYDYQHSVKQPIVRTQRIGSKLQHIYEGDTTFSFVNNRAMGNDFTKHMNEISRLIRARQYKDAKNYAKSVFDIEWKDLYAGFRPSKNPLTGEITPPRFSTDPRQEFRVVPMGKSIKDLDKQLQSKYRKRNSKTDVDTDTFVDGTRHGSMARNFQVAYTQPRDSYALHEAVNAGTVDKPFYNFRPAKLTDPITVMTRALNRIVNSSYMDSYKITAAEHWLQENMGLMEATQDEIRNSPFYYFNEGKMKTNPYTTLQRSNAETNRIKIKQLIGTPSWTSSAIQGVKQQLSDALYESGRDRALATIDQKLGNTKLAKVVKAPLVAPEWMLDHIGHPVDFLRGMTYHVNLGLFSFKQLFVQSSAYTTIYGLAGPLKATQGSFAALMHQWTRMSSNPVIIAEMDRRATYFGWKPGEFTEANKFLNRSGFGHVGKEISLADGLNQQNFFLNDAKGILSLGQIPFNEGNLHVRFGAWYTAFKEFRDANPVKKITQSDEGKILYRANYLNTLMSRDANTILNKGLLGVPFQFFDYMKKMSDVFWSPNLGNSFVPDTLLKVTDEQAKSIPKADLVRNADGVFRVKSTNTAARRAYVRLRMYAFYAILGGAVGAAAVQGIPTDSIRKHALAGDLPFQTSAYVPGANLWSTLVMEGPLSTLLNGLTGHLYNFNDRVNPNGIQMLRDVMQTDPTFWKLLLGASGTTVGTEIASLSGFTNAVYSMIEGDPAKEAWPLMLDDWIKPLDTIGSWSDAKRLRYALAFGKWIDKHGQPQSDVGKVDSIFRTLTGLTDQRLDDKYLMSLTKKDEKSAFDAAGNEYLEQRRLAEQAAASDDPQQADEYNKRAFYALTSNNVPVEAWGKYLQRDAEMNRDMLDKNNENYYLKYVPTNRQEKALEAFRKIQQMKDQ